MLLRSDFGTDQSVKGALGVIYTSTPIIFDQDPAKAVKPVVRGTINTLEAAARAGIKRYVLSGSSKAVETTVYNQPHRITEKMYNYDAIIKMCCEPVVDSWERKLNVYSASRALAELAFWSWIGNHEPGFAANCVVPDGQFGRVLDTDHIASSGNMLRNAMEGKWDEVFPHLGQLASKTSLSALLITDLSLGYYIDVQDTARLLVAALASAEISNERIFAYRYNASWNDLRQRISEMQGSLEVVKGGNQGLEGRDLSDASRSISRAEAILRHVGRPGFTSEESLLRDWLKSYDY